MKQSPIERERRELAEVNEKYDVDAGRNVRLSKYCYQTKLKN